MMSWVQRSREERTLLNPSFCAMLYWYAAYGHVNFSGKGISFENTFLILPFILHRETREMLPRKTSTSLATWLGDNPLVRSIVITRAKHLVHVTKEGILFGGVYGFILFNEGCIYPNKDCEKRINQILNMTSDEVNTCAKKAELLGRWFAKSGNTRTILALVGVRP